MSHAKIALYLTVAMCAPAYGQFNSTPPVGFYYCAAEGEQCTLPGQSWITFGSANLWTPPRPVTPVNGSYGCSNAIGEPGGVPPRQCYFRQVGAAWPSMLPMPSAMASLDTPLAPPEVLPSACQPIELGGTGVIGLAGRVEGGWAEARWCKSPEGWIGYFRIVEDGFKGPPRPLTFP